MIRSQSVTPNSGTLPIDAAGNKHNVDNQIPKLNISSGSSTLTGRDTGFVIFYRCLIKNNSLVRDIKQHLHPMKLWSLISSCRCVCPEK